MRYARVITSQSSYLASEGNRNDVCFYCTTIDVSEEKLPLLVADLQLDSTDSILVEPNIEMLRAMLLVWSHVTHSYLHTAERLQVLKSQN